MGIKIAKNQYMPETKILILDEQGFSRICSALLSNDGHVVRSAEITDVGKALDYHDIGLIVTSYPDCTSIFNKIRKSNIPVLILADNVDENLIKMLNNFICSFCMVKPLDYAKFKSLVKDFMSSRFMMTEGYTVV